MKNIKMIFIILSLVLGITCYIACNSYVIAICIGLFSISFFLFLISPKIKKYIDSVTRYNNFHQFMNSFIISLSVTNSLEISYANAKSTLIETYRNLLQDRESFYELVDIFPYNNYRLFSDVIRLWEEEGGDILKESEYILRLSRNAQEEILEASHNIKKTLVDFIALWSISISIMVFIRFALKQFYEHIANNMVYQIGTAVVILFALISVYIFTQKACAIDLNEVKEDE